MNKIVRFEFGYGLSYSDFAYGDLDVYIGSVSELLPTPPRPIIVSKPTNYTRGQLLKPKEFKPIRGVVYPWIDVNSLTAGDALPGVSPALAVLLGLPGPDTCPAVKDGTDKDGESKSSTSKTSSTESKTASASSSSASPSKSNSTISDSDIPTVGNSTFHYANGTGVITNAAGGIGGNPALWQTVATVSHTTRNKGPYAGAVVTQLYIAFPNATNFETPKVQLRGFDKSRVLEVGESQITSYDIMWRDLAVWDVEIQSWRVQRGEYKVFVGQSSRDFVLQDVFTLQ